MPQRHFLASIVTKVVKNTHSSALTTELLGYSLTVPQILSRDVIKMSRSLHKTFVYRYSLLVALERGTECRQSATDALCASGFSSTSLQQSILHSVILAQNHRPRNPQSNGNMVYVCGERFVYSDCHLGAQHQRCRTIMMPAQLSCACISSVIPVKVRRCHVYHDTTQKSNASNDSMVLSSRDKKQVSPAYMYQSQAGLIRAKRPSHSTALIDSLSIRNPTEQLSIFGSPNPQPFI